MKNNSLLHYQFDLNPTAKHPITLVFLHGLFGDLNNLNTIAKKFQNDYNLLKVDLRNHGNSFHHDEMNYQLMAEDLMRLLHQLNITQAILIGHSMGGKTAMATAALLPELIKKLIIIDIAPIHYETNRHEKFFEGLFAVKKSQPASRQKAIHILSQYIDDVAIQQFMLKSFSPQHQGYFRFNLDALHRNYGSLMSWQSVQVDIPTLFIKGDLSDYILPQNSAIILKQFPQAKFFVVNNADHWVHAERPDAVIRAINRFLN